MGSEIKILKQLLMIKVIEESHEIMGNPPARLMRSNNFTLNFFVSCPPLRLTDRWSDRFCANSFETHANLPPPKTGRYCDNRIRCQSATPQEHHVVSRWYLSEENE